MRRFHSIDDFLEYLPDKERLIVDELRAIILDVITDVEEKLAYNVPYYYRHSRICFIWPASIPWGNVTMKGVQLGFCQGHLLNDQSDYLEKGNRKQVFSKTFFDPKHIDHDLIKSYLFEAVTIDSEIRGVGKRLG